jgi:eukaryotic-like serine/threonine-protein kinase
VLASDPTFVARFEREARLAAALNHPNLVKLFDFAAEDGRPLLVMEYVPGGTLLDKRHGIGDPVGLARDLLDALAHIHGAGILHRDIKPGNVLLGADGSPRLTDFGVARMEDQTGLTLTGQVLGTLRYIAPEVAAGEPASRRSDLYSLGVVLRRVAGERPPGQLARLLDRMTADDPVQRPASAEEALAELEPTRPLERRLPDFRPHRGHKSGEPATNAAPPSAVRRIRIHVRPRTWLGAAAALALLAAAVIAIATSGSGGGRKPAPAARAVPQPAPPQAPLADQLDRLEQIVRAAPRRR